MSVRWSKRVAEGIGHILSLVDAELTAHELSSLECRCDGCCSNGHYQDDGTFMQGACLCDGKSFDKQCEGCRTTTEMMAAEAWLSKELGRRGAKGGVR